MAAVNNIHVIFAGCLLAGLSWVQPTTVSAAAAAAASNTTKPHTTTKQPKQQPAPVVVHMQTWTRPWIDDEELLELTPLLSASANDASQEYSFHVQWEPMWWIVSGESLGCRVAATGSGATQWTSDTTRAVHCQQHCLNKGRYCYADHFTHNANNNKETHNTKPVEHWEGYESVWESLHRECLWRSYHFGNQHPSQQPQPHPPETNYHSQQQAMQHQQTQRSQWMLHYLLWLQRHPECALSAVFFGNTTTTTTTNTNTTVCHEDAAMKQLDMQALEKCVGEWIPNGQHHNHTKQETNDAVTNPHALQLGPHVDQDHFVLKAMAQAASRFAADSTTTTTTTTNDSDSSITITTIATPPFLLFRDGRQQEQMEEIPPQASSNTLLHLICNHFSAANNRPPICDYCIVYCRQQQGKHAIPLKENDAMQCFMEQHCEYVPNKTKTLTLEEWVQQQYGGNASSLGLDTTNKSATTIPKTPPALTTVRMAVGITVACFFALLAIRKLVSSSRQPPPQPMDPLTIGERYQDGDDEDELEDVDVDTMIVLDPENATPTTGLPALA